MTLKRFSYVMSAAFFVLVAVAALLLVFMTSRMGESSVSTADAVKSIRAAEELHVQLLNHHRQALIQEITKSREIQTKLLAGQEKIHYWLTQVGEHVDSNNDEEAQLFAKTSESVQRYLNVPNELMESRLNEASQNVEALTNLNLQQAEFYRQRLQADDDLANLLGVAIIFFAVLVIPASWYLVRKNLYQPILSLHRSMKDFTRSQPRKVEELGLVETREIAKAFNELMDRLSEQKKSRLRFLAGVAHDLRNPLSAIKMSSEILLEESAGAKEVSPIIQIISRQSEQLDRMVGDLLDSTRIEAGQLDLQKRTENLIPIITDAVQLYKTVSQLHDIHFITNESQINCVCDRTRVSQVLNNLLSNAIKYSPNGGVIKVSARIEGGNAVIDVHDQGIGIPKADQERIFEPFRRTEMTKSSIPGVGLGLSVVKRIVNAHEGEITVESEPDVGTTFTFKVPLANEAEVRTSQVMTFH